MTQLPLYPENERMMLMLQRYFIKVTQLPLYPEEERGEQDQVTEEKASSGLWACIRFWKIIFFPPNFSPIFKKYIFNEKCDICSGCVQWFSGGGQFVWWSKGRACHEIKINLSTWTLNNRMYMFRPTQSPHEENCNNFYRRQKFVTQMHISKLP